MSRTKPWELSDAMWERAQPLLPPHPPHPKGGRPPRDDRQMLGAMLYVLRTGLQWNALPHTIGASTTVYDRFRAWEREGFFERLWAAGLAEFDELVGIDWEWQSLDGAMTKAPFARAATAEAEGFGHNPTDRGKYGTKRSTLTEGHGLPVAVVVAGANVHDLKLAAPTLDALVVDRPPPTAEQPQHLCLDAGYDYDLPRFAAEQRHYTAHIRPRGEERANAGSDDPTKRPRRWVVERLHSWLNRSRRLLVRWEKLARTYQAFLHLACALLCFQQCDRYRAVLDVSE
ncbi:MAG TPA: IS5 family transposase [Ktedonobacterales bacterium]